MNDLRPAHGNLAWTSSNNVGTCILQPYIKRSEVDKKRYEKELKRCKLKWCTTKWRATSEAANYPRSFKNLPVNILLRITDVKEQLFGEEKNYNWIFSSDPRL